MIAVRLRLKRAREAAGKSHEELGRLVGGRSTYWDLECHDAELFMAVSLNQLTRLCAEFGITVRSLFDERFGQESTLTPEQLMLKPKEHMAQSGLGLGEFEARIGFEFGPALQDPAEVLDWNVDFLRWLCRELALDWRLALPSTVTKKPEPRSGSGCD